jgi:hypothetical protein
LDACYEAREPELRFVQFFDGLRRQADWSGPEIDEIEDTARMLMSGYFDRRQNSHTLSA